VVTAVLCAYCRAAIPADSFGYWSPAKRLLSASCPDCHRRVTVAAPMWRRWSAVGSSGLGTSAPANDHHDPRPHARPPPGPCSAACRSPRRGCWRASTAQRWSSTGPLPQTGASGSATSPRSVELPFNHVSRQSARMTVW